MADPTPNDKPNDKPNVTPAPNPVFRDLPKTTDTREEFDARQAHEADDRTVSERRADAATARGDAVEAVRESAPGYEVAPDPRSDRDYRPDLDTDRERRYRGDLVAEDDADRETRARLGILHDRPLNAQERDIVKHDQLVGKARDGLEALSALALLKIVTLYQNRRTRYLVNAEAERLDLDPDGVHAVLAELPSPNSAY